jgi:hypothetical protein
MISFRVMITALIFAILYLIVADRLRKFGKRYRIEALTFGDRLLKDSSVPSELKSTVEGILVRVPYSSIAWRYMFGAIPAAIYLAFGRYPKIHVDRKAPYFDTWDFFTDAALLASLCNSPAAAVLFGIELGILSFFVSAQKIVEIIVERAGTAVSSGSHPVVKVVP